MHEGVVVFPSAESTLWAGVNHVALIYAVPRYLSQSVRRRSMPTVALKTPRETSVGFAS